MFTEGDVVIRVKGSECIENTPALGVRCIVECVINEDMMTLKGYGEVLQYQAYYKLAEKPLRPHSAIQDVKQALHVINSWNKTHPSAGRISIEADEELNGGDLFLLGDSFDTHDISELITKLSLFLTNKERKEQRKLFRDMLDDDLI